MTSLASKPPIVVGIDGSQSGANALLWAADEAERRGSLLRVVHAGDVPDGDALSPTTLAAAQAEVESYGRQLIADAIATLAETHPRVQVTTTLRAAHPAQLLIEFSAAAVMLVVGTRGRGRFTDLLLGSVSQRVAGHAECPVVVLNEQPLADTPVGVIVAGVSGSDVEDRALRFACAEAVVRDAGVLAVHCSTPPTSALSNLAPSGVDLESWRHRQQRALDERVAAVGADFPSVTVTARLSSAAPHLALVDAAADAQLLVVGRRRPNAAYLARLGPLSSWLLHESPVPLALVG